MSRLRALSLEGPVSSIGLHLLTLVLLIVAFRQRPVVARPLHLPGTLQGQRMLLSYSAGAPAAASQTRAVTREPVYSRLPRPKPAPSAAKPLPSAPVTFASEKGSGTAGDSAFGDENIRVALPQVHPHPQPDLSSLPHGAAGDVVVDVVIDDSGKITSTTLVKGLGAPIDTAVMQVLHDWVFTPATKDGKNIASEQEILIHYQRG